MITARRSGPGFNRKMRLRLSLLADALGFADLSVSGEMATALPPDCHSDGSDRSHTLSPKLFDDLLIGSQPM